MKDQVTFGHILTILGIVVVPLIIWGVSIEKRFETMILNSNELYETKQVLKEIEKDSNGNYQKLYNLMIDIKLELKDKKNRD